MARTATPINALQKGAPLASRMPPGKGSLHPRVGSTMRILHTVEQGLLAGAVLAILGTWAAGGGRAHRPAGEESPARQTREHPRAPRSPGPRPGPNPGGP